MTTRNVFLFGLDKAGKTALSNFMKNETTLPTLPTLAFHIDKWVIESTKFQIYDAPGQEKLRSQWRKMFPKAQVLVFVLDLSVPERFEEAKRELDTVITEPTTFNRPLFILLHKADLAKNEEIVSQARIKFDPLKFKFHPVYQYTTSIFDPASIKSIKVKFTELFRDE